MFSTRRFASLTRGYVSLSLFKALLTCRGRGCLPENTRSAISIDISVGAFGRENPAPTIIIKLFQSVVTRYAINKINSWAVRIRKNITNGYTVE